MSTATVESTSVAPTTPALVVGTAFSLGKASERRILALAGAAVTGSTDPVDEAVARAYAANYPDMALPVVAPEDTEAASLTRRYTVTRVRGWDDGNGPIRDRVVLRGDLEAVLAKVKPGGEDRRVLRRNADVVTGRGWRPLAVASAPVDEADNVGAFSVLGFVPVCPETVKAAVEDISSGPASWARVRLWSASLRLQHWSNVILIFVLSCTGFLILDPFAGPMYHISEASGYLMGVIRLIHFTAAFLWLLVGLTRIWSAFTSRDRALRWPTMWPLKSKEDVRNLGRVLQHYAFIKEDAPLYLAHNPLQQLAYTSVYIACAVQMAVGFMLFGLYHQANWFWALLATPTHWIGVPAMRLLHTIIMFALWMFVIMHIYLVLRAEAADRHGGLSAMINGGVWVKRGVKPVDAPVIE